MKQTCDWCQNQKKDNQTAGCPACSEFKPTKEYFAAVEKERADKAAKETATINRVYNFSKPKVSTDNEAPSPISPDSLDNKVEEVIADDLF